MEEQTEAAAKALEALDRIAQEAYDKTGGDIWGTDPPAEIPADSPPAAEKPAVESAGSPDETLAKESTSEPAPLIMGKYKSLEEAERGYHEAVRMGNLAKAEADALRQRVESVEKAVGKGSTPITEPDPLDEIENYGVPKEVIARAMKREARAAIDEMFAPAIARTAADKQIIEKYPEYQEKFSEIEQFAESTPELRAQLVALNDSGNYLAARQIAYLNWKVAQTTAATGTKAALETARTEEAKDSRRDAGVGSTRRADTRATMVKPEKSAEEERRLVDLYKSGHPAPYLRSKLDDMLPPNFDDLTAQILG